MLDKATDGLALDHVVTCPNCGNVGRDHAIKLLDHPERLFTLDAETSRISQTPVWSNRTVTDDGGGDALWCERCGHEWPWDSAVHDDVFLD